MIITVILGVILGLVAFVCTKKLEHRADDLLERIQQIRQAYGEDLKPFSVPEYYERVENLQLELHAEKESQQEYIIILWWGLDGLRLNDDGSFEWISKRKKNTVKQEAQKQAVKEKIQSLQPETNDSTIQLISENIQRLEKLKDIFEKQLNDAKSMEESYITLRALMNVCREIAYKKDKLRSEIAKQHGQASRSTFDLLLQSEAGIICK